MNGFVSGKVRKLELGWKKNLSLKRKHHRVFCKVNENTAPEP
jgi:hypothetical protein